MTEDEVIELGARYRARRESRRWSALEGRMVDAVSSPPKSEEDGAVAEVMAIVGAERVALLEDYSYRVALAAIAMGVSEDVAAELGADAAMALWGKSAR